MQDQKLQIKTNRSGIQLLLEKTANGGKNTSYDKFRPKNNGSLSQVLMILSKTTANNYLIINLIAVAFEI